MSGNTTQLVSSLGTLLAGVTAILHATYSLSVKYGLQRKNGRRNLPPMALAFWLNIGAGLLSLTFISLAKIPFGEIWLDVLPAALFYFVGLLLMVAGLKQGRASVVGPLLGVKVFFASLASVLIAREELNPIIWLGVTIAMPAMVLGSYSEGERISFRTIFQRGSVLMLGAAFCYAGADGFYRLAFLTHGDRLGMFLYGNIMIGLLSFLILPFLKSQDVVGHSFMTWLTMVSVIMINAVMLTTSIYALTMKDNIAITNIVFSSRTVVIIPMALLVDRLLRHKMDNLTPKTFWIRMAGASILLFAIGLCLLVKI